MNTNKNSTKDEKLQDDKKVLNLVGSNEVETNHSDLRNPGM